MNRTIRRCNALALISLLILGVVMSGGSALATASSTVVTNPDAYSCTQRTNIDFEQFSEGHNLSQESIQGLQFTTTGGYTWKVGDWQSGLYNGKYPAGDFTSQANKWAWLGPDQGSGRIDFVNGTVGHFSLLTSNGSNMYLEAYSYAGTLLETAGPGAPNTGTGNMNELKLVRSESDIAYVVVHDSGNFFLIDSICSDALGVSTSDLRLTTNVRTVATSPKTVPMQDLPLQPNSPSGTEGSALRDISIIGSPLRDISIIGSPLRDISIIGSPLAAGTLAESTLADILLLRDGGWEEQILKGTALAGLNLSTITFKQLLDLNPPELSGVKLGELDLGPLANLSAASFVLSKVRARDITLPASDPGFCHRFQSFGFSECGKGLGGLDATLMAMELGGFPADTLPLSGLKLNQINLTNAALLDIRLGGTDLQPGIDSTVGIENTAFGAVKYSQVPDPSLVFSCTVCSSELTIAQAAENGQIKATALVRHLGTLTNGKWSTTIPLINDQVTLGEVIFSLMNVTDVPVEDIPLDSLGLPYYGGRGATSVDYKLAYTHRGPTVSGPVAAATLPESFIYVAGTSAAKVTTAFTSATSVIADPTRDGSNLSWNLSSVTLNDGDKLELTFTTRPGLTLGTFTSSASLSAADLTKNVSDVAPVTVVDAWEDNSSPDGAKSVGHSSVNLSHIATAGDVDYFRINASENELPPAQGTRLAFSLSHLSHDADIVVYLPPNAPSSQALGTPLRDISIIGSPLTDPGTELDGSASQAPTEVLEDVPLLPGRSVAGFSANRSLSDEYVEVAVPGGLSYSDQFLVQVSGYNGSSSELPYMLRAKSIAPLPQPPCATTRPWTNTGIAGQPFAGIPAGTETLFLVNQKRLGDMYGPTEAAKVTSALNSNFLGHAAVKGAIAPLDRADTAEGQALQTAYGNWDSDQCNPESANSVVRSIGSYVDSLVPPGFTTLKSIVIVGTDSVVPFARVDDFTYIVNESTYLQDVSFTRGSPSKSNSLTSSFALSKVMTDNPYGDVNPIPWLGQYLYVPDFALGRLGETPSQIAAQITQFATYNGELDPAAKSFSTSYDFIKDLGTKLDGILGTPGLNTETWTANDLGAGINKADPAEFISPNGHADHFRILSAKGNSTNDPSETFGTDRLTNSLNRSVVFTMGCNAGLNIENVLLAAPSSDQSRRLNDWAQALSGKGAAAFAGNTGHGYGDRYTIAYSERLLMLFAQNLKAGLSTGDALRFAKQAYFAEQGAYDVFFQKSLEEMTHWGLPMWKLPASAATPSSSSVPPVGAVTTDAPTGLQAANVHVEPNLVEKTTSGGSFFQVGTELPQVNLYQPLTAKTQLDATKSGLVAKGVFIKGLVSSEVSGYNPAISVPIYDDSANQSEPQTEDLAFPASLWNLGTELTPTGLKQRLNLLATQFRSAGTQNGNVVGTLRKFSSIDAQVFYAPESSTDLVAPRFTSISATVTGSAPNFTANFIAKISAPGDTVKATSVVVKQGSNWTYKALTDNGNGTWSASMPVTSSVLRYFAQTVDSNGNVGRTHNKAIDHGDSVAPKITITSPVSGAVFTLGQTVASDFACSDGGAGMDSCSAEAPVTQSGDPIDTSTPGKHVFRVTAADKAGNVAIKEAVYYVKSNFIGFLAPIKGTDDPTGEINTVKGGQAIPLKWQMKNSSGGYYRDLKASDLLIQWKGLSCDANRAESLLDDPSILTLGVGLKYDPISEQYLLVLDTPKTGWAGLCRRLYVTLNGVDTHFADFKFK